MKATTTQKILWFFENCLKSQEAVSTSRKYRAFDVIMEDGTVQRYWVGKAGAVRVGRTISESVPVEYVKAMALRYWERHHA